MTDLNLVNFLSNNKNKKGVFHTGIKRDSLSLNMKIFSEEKKKENV